MPSAAKALLNVIIRPRSATTLLVQLDDLDADKVVQIVPHAFMTVCTSPGNYQLWLAVSDGPKESDKEAAKLFRKCAKLQSPGVDMKTEIVQTVTELWKLALAITLAGSYVAATPRLWLDIRLYLPEYR